MTAGTAARHVHVAVCGALGRMGMEVVKTVLNDSELIPAGFADVNGGDRSMMEITGGMVSVDCLVYDSLTKMLADCRPEVCVDFTHPDTVLENTLALIDAGVRPVVGTTGLSNADLAQIRDALAQRKIGGIVAPNFAIGAVLMMKFAAEASKYLGHAEIIELHHNQKADAPSGTAIKTAQLMAEARDAFGTTNAAERETITGARGGTGPADIHIHSVRLPGLVAHQEVIFGGQGQTLTIRHDSIDRTSFMPGVAMACKKVMDVDGLVYGLENLL